MKVTRYIIAAALLALFISCDTKPEALDLQPLKEYSEEYYQALRDYKATPHEICYVYYADWAPIEGASGYKDPASWGERIIGLPDSIDIVNLWMGIPTPETHPIAYQDMIETREKKGTRFVFHADASNYNHKFTIGGKVVPMHLTITTSSPLAASPTISPVTAARKPFVPTPAGSVTRLSRQALTEPISTTRDGTAST